MARAPMGFGNIVIRDHSSGIVELRLNTVSKNGPHALFTTDSIPLLCKVLTDYASKAPKDEPKAADEDDDDNFDGMDLV